MKVILTLILTSIFLIIALPNLVLAGFDRQDSVSLSPLSDDDDSKTFVPAILPDAPVFLHLVQPGDTLSSLSKLYGVRAELILQVNSSIGQGRALQEVRTLVIPE